MFDALITTGDLAERLYDERWRVFDCRFSLTDPDLGRRQYEESHVPGAAYVHLDKDLSTAVGPTTGRHPLPAAEEAAARFRKLGVNQDSQVAVYDDGSGAMAARMWWMLRWLGHGPAAVLDGGFAAWMHAGLPISTVETRFPPGNLAARPRADMVAGMEDVRHASAEGSMRIVDARGPERFRGESEPLDSKAGHVPGAVNIAFATHLTRDGRFRPRAELAESFRRALGSRAEDGQVIHMCGSGVTACHSYLAMTAAGLNPGRVYPGSWSEWITDADNPVATGD
jgi:thiosulfate/3-mercaptopyruvate sulfurtransferase